MLLKSVASHNYSSEPNTWLIYCACSYKCSVAKCDPRTSLITPYLSRLVRVAASSSSTATRIRCRHHARCFVFVGVATTDKSIAWRSTANHQTYRNRISPSTASCPGPLTCSESRLMKAQNSALKVAISQQTDPFGRIRFSVPRN